MYPEWLTEMVITYCVRVIELFLRIREIVSGPAVVYKATLHSCLCHVALIEPSGSTLRFKQHTGPH